MPKNDLIATIVGIVAGAVVLFHFLTLSCDYMQEQSQQSHDQKIKQYELME